MAYNFEGKRALVTGASRGIGRDIAIALSKAGATTFVIARSESNLQKLKEEHPKINTLCVDLQNWEEAREVVKSIGRVDLLVNNAATTRVTMSLQCVEDDFDTLFSLNLKSVVNITQIVAQSMIDQGEGGAIVNVSSLGSKATVPSYFVYSLTKAALDKATEIMAVEFGKHNIRVNAVNPTLVIGTDMSTEAIEANPDLVSTTKEKVPCGEFPVLEDVTNVVLFLLSDKSKFVNGETILIDGGLYLMG